MRYVMKNEGFPYKNIYVRRNRVGRVVRHADGHYIGIIGPIQRTGLSERAAFDAVVSADLGFESVEKLNAHNRSVRAENRDRRAAAMGRAMQDPMFRDIMESIAQVRKALR